MSGALSEKFDSAREKADVLTESMVSSNNSVKEIASSVKLTAEAIEQQTMQTNGIQTNIENAEKETKEMQTASDATQDALREGADLIAELKEQATQTGGDQPRHKNHDGRTGQPHKGSGGHYRNDFKHFRSDQSACTQCVH